MPDYIVKTGFSSQQASGAIYVIFLLFIVFLRSLAERIADYRRIQTKQAYLRAAATGSAAPKPPAPSKPGFWRRFFVSHHLPVFSSLFGTSLGTADAFELAVILAANLLLMIIPLPYPTPEQVAKGQIWSINSVSKRMAWIGCGNMFWILLTATRNSVLTFITGVPFERHIMYHRWFGWITFFEFTLHSILTFVYLSQSGKLQVEVTTLVNIFGIISWICLVVLSLLSVPAVRRLHRVVRMWRSSKVAEVVEVKAMEGKQGSGCTKVTVRFKGSKAHGQGLEAGQYAFISARGPKSFYLSRLFWHPFSASSAPNDDGLVTFHAKTAGPFTNALQEAVSSRDPESQDAPLSLGVDGFHGRLRTDLTHSTHVVLVAGGIGLAPLLSIARDVANKMSTPLDLDGPTLAYSTRKVTLIWYTRTAEEFGWFEEEWKELEDANARLEKGGYRVELKAFVTRDEAPAGMNTCHVGKPDIAVVLEGLVKNERTSVAVCGPAGLVRDTRQGCAALIGKGLDVDAHWEVFEL